MDFRAIDPRSSFAISPTKSRNLYPFVPRVPVQLPRASLVITLGVYGYNVIVRMDENVRAHKAFVEWAQRVDDVGMEAVRVAEPLLAWTTSVKGYGCARSLYLTIDQGSLVFDEDRTLLDASPCTIRRGDIIAEIAGVWTSPTNAGLRWKLMQLKKCAPEAAEPAFGADPADLAPSSLRPPPVAAACAFVDDNDE